MDFRSYLGGCASLVDKELRRLLSSLSEVPSPLFEAMEYAVFGGGKRLRPALVMFANQMFRPSPAATTVGAAVELVHTYSLVHDDLPAMDDDDVRRGKPTVHVAFDEATAILCGDALLTLGFQALASLPSLGVDVETSCRLSLELARAAGAEGMVGGQTLDIAMPPDSPAALIERMHDMKTARLFCASVRMGALLGDAPLQDLIALTEYARHFGALYQAQDDLEDFQDHAGQGTEVTYPSRCGIEATRERSALEAGRALESLRPFGERAWWLRDLVDFVKSR